MAACGWLPWSVLHPPAHLGCLKSIKVSSKLPPAVPSASLSANGGICEIGFRPPVCVCVGGSGFCDAKQTADMEVLQEAALLSFLFLRLPPAFRAQSAVRTARRLVCLPLLSLLTQGTPGAPS